VPSEVNLIAPGLLGALQAKSKGQNPSMLGDTIAPTLEMREWLLMQDRAYAASAADIQGATDPNTSAAFLNTNPLIQIPQGEAWYVWNVSLWVAVKPGDILDGGVWTAVQLIDGTTSLVFLHFLAPGIPIAPGGAADAVVAAGGDVRRWFLPGAIFGMGYGELTIGAASFAEFHLSVEYTRLPL